MICSVLDQVSSSLLFQLCAAVIMSRATPDFEAPAWTNPERLLQRIQSLQDEKIKMEREYDAKLEQWKDMKKQYEHLCRVIYSAMMECIDNQPTSLSILGAPPGPCG